jgi:hypothetical protein
MLIAPARSTETLGLAAKAAEDDALQAMLERASPQGWDRRREA